MYSCVGTILSSLKEPVKRHGAYVFQYEDLVRQLEQENRGLGEIKDRIERLVDTATRNARCIEPGVSRWLGEVEQTERDIAIFLRQQENREQMARDFANFLRQQENGEQMERDIANILRQKENGEQMERDIANFLRQQENGEQMEQDFANFRRQQDFANFLRQQENGEQMERDLANFLRQQENGEQIMERDFANFLRQQENGEQMERDFAKFLRQQEDGESFKCFPGCMCPNLMWRHERGMEADKKKSKVIELIGRGDRLKRLPVSYAAPFQSEPLFESPYYYTTFSSRASVFDDIMNALKDSGVGMIGVHGPGGAGKTTMVKEVAKEAKKQGIFYKIVIAVVSKDPNISKLQADLAPQLDLKYKQDSELGRADELGKALSNGKRKILVILDDLWQALDLKAIGIPVSGPGPEGCKILLTSRVEEVFKQMEVCLYFPIGYLKELEAWELFRKVTGDFGVDECTAREVCKKCADLPIAIVAVGVALKGEEERVWRNALSQLTKSPLKYFEGVELVGYTPLKWSYDFLKDEGAKSCFLLCCLFPEDAEISIDDLVRYSFALGFLEEVDTLKAARDRVQAMVYMLRRSCLLINGKNKNFVKMHDVIRDLAIFITEEKQTEHDSGHDWPGKQQFIVDHNIREWPRNDAWKHHTAISVRINNKNIHFPCGVLHCPLMHTLVLKLGKSSLKIPNDFFQGMKGARVLDFEDVLLDLPSLVLELNHLRMLRLNNCQLLKDLAAIQNLKNHIEILSFEGSSIKDLPQEIGELTCLRTLDMRGCKSLKVIPNGVISRLIHLEELYVAQNFKEWDTTIDGGGMSNASIVELKSLTQLTILHVCISAESSRIMVQECRDLFEKLMDFCIIITVGFYYGDQSLNALEIHGTHHIDDEFYLLMDKVEELRLSKIQELRHLLGKPQLQRPPRDWRSFSKLISLDIFECNSIKYLFSPSCAKALQELQTLVVWDCRTIEQIIGGVDDEDEDITDEVIIFSRLTKIELYELPQFKGFYPIKEKTTIQENPSNCTTSEATQGNPSNCTTSEESIFNEKVFFPILEELSICGLPIMKDIWNKQVIKSPRGSNEVSFSQLKVVKIYQCDNLVNVFPLNMLSRLQNLKTLLVHNCPSLILLVEDKFKFIDVFPKLRCLHLKTLPKLMKIWLSDENYDSYDNSIRLYLESIIITGCDSLRCAFSACVLRHHMRIQDFCVEACLGMESIVSETRGKGETDDDMITFKELKSLWLERLPKLKSFYESKSGASHLFNHQVSFPVLEYLKIDELLVEDIWNKQVIQSPEESNEISFSQLKDVEVIQCANLVNVFPSDMLPRLQKLETLHVGKCSSLRLLVEDFNPNIQNPIVKSKFADVFPKLRCLELDNLPELMKTWLSDGDYYSYNNFVDLYLESMRITGCGRLRHAFSDFVARRLVHIQHLSIEACPEMEVIVSKAREEEVTDNGMIKFCELKRLEFQNLPKLKSFYQSKSETSHLLNCQDFFPKLEEWKIPKELGMKIFGISK